MLPDVFTPAERAVFRRLNQPEKIQRFLDCDLAYNKEPGGPSCRSPRRVLRDRTAHCMEGALFGAAALRTLGHPPLLLDLEAVRDDDHVLASVQIRGHWGARQDRRARESHHCSSIQLGQRPSVRERGIRESRVPGIAVVN